MRRKNKDLNPDTSILTADEVAEYLKLSKITVYKLAKQGSILVQGRRILEVQ